MTARELLLYISHRHGGEWNAMMRAIKAKETVSPQEVTDFASTHNRNYITLLNPKYPETLKKIAQPPLVLYYKGNLDLIRDMNRSVTLVG